ncbi:unnamed protein product [Angiostrongylus costaricensis]|uniref:Uncharacterized protein n=1 Tax=Angiostrongylus costaricensis TaxID=334426 RepID=A0A0R3PPE2_ANGCS|nr:unnamed protein product [Angiostrongylus costaricensis]
MVISRLSTPSFAVREVVQPYLPSVRRRSVGHICGGGRRCGRFVTIVAFHAQALTHHLVCSFITTMHSGADDGRIAVHRWKSEGTSLAQRNADGFRRHARTTPKFAAKETSIDTSAEYSLIRIMLAI